MRETFAVSMVPSRLDHLWFEIEQPDVFEALGEGQTDTAGAASKIEQALASRKARDEIVEKRSRVCRTEARIGFGGAAEGIGREVRCFRHARLDPTRPPWPASCPGRCVPGPSCRQ